MMQQKFKARATKAPTWLARMIQMLTTRLTAIAVALALSASAALGDVALGDLVGDWRGTGTIAALATEPAQRGRCSAAIRAGDASNELVIEGLCAAGAGQTEFILTARFDAGGQVAAGLWTNRQNATASFAGTRRGDRIELNSVSQFSVDGVLYSSRLVMDVFELDRFSFEQYRRPTNGAGEWQALGMVFSRR